MVTDLSPHNFLIHARYPYVTTYHLSTSKERSEWEQQCLSRDAVFFLLFFPKSSSGRTRSTCCDSELRMRTLDPTETTCKNGHLLTETVGLYSREVRNLESTPSTNQLLGTRHPSTSTLLMFEEVGLNLRGAPTL